jgi:uncharacterized protein (TIGR02058 family)
MGMGTDVHGRDYTKAACRAVSDALRHSSLNFFAALGKSPHDMQITVSIGVAVPELIDRDKVAKEFPYGTVTVNPVIGGLDLAADQGKDAIVIANAAVVVCFDE